MHKEKKAAEKEKEGEKESKDVRANENKVRE